MHLINDHLMIIHILILQFSVYDFKSDYTQIPNNS